MNRRIRLLNGEFDACTLAEAADGLIDRAHRGKRGWIASINVATLMMMRRNRFLQRFAKRAVLSLADGQPLVWLSHLCRTPLPERVAGIDLMIQLCSRAAQDDLPVYLLGAAPGVARAAAANLQAWFPELKIAGAAHGYFEKEEAPHRAHEIHASGAVILFVGMGAPRQERFIEEHWEALGARVVLPVGGSFDVLAGHIARAPQLLQQIGLEWAFRLAQEPKRLFTRYFVSNSVFIIVVCRAFLLCYYNLVFHRLRHSRKKKELRPPS
jgi:N-acetylglucosaminyldiphosphoundecaprenol N-acetyl-beta-D-mannosaminyltransferase